MNHTIHRNAFGPHTSISFTVDATGMAHLPGSTFAPEHWPTGWTEDAFRENCKRNLLRVLEVVAGLARVQGGILAQLTAEMSRVVGTEAHDFSLYLSESDSGSVVVQRDREETAILPTPERTLAALRAYPSGSGEAAAWGAL